MLDLVDDNKEQLLVCSVHLKKNKSLYFQICKDSVEPLILLKQHSNRQQ